MLSQSLFRYDTDYAPPILLLVWHWLCLANPPFTMIPTMPHQSLFGYYTTYALPILLPWYRQCPANPSRSFTMTLTKPHQSLFGYYIDYVLPILFLVWHQLCPTNPSFSMTPTRPTNPLFGHDTDYAPPILIWVWHWLCRASLMASVMFQVCSIANHHPFSAFLKAGLQTSSLNIRG